MRQYLLNVATAIDQLLSALLGGDEDETLSSRLGKAQRGDYGTKMQLLLTPVAKCVNVVFRPLEGQWEHCLRHIEDDEGKAEILFEDMA